MLKYLRDNHVTGCVRVAKKETDDRITVRMPKELRDLVKAEKKQLGISTVSPIYVTAVKFYFDNKNNPLYSTPEELTAMIESKFDSLTRDQKRLQALKKALSGL